MDGIQSKNHTELKRDVAFYLIPLTLMDYYNTVLANTDAMYSDFDFNRLIDDDLNV